MKPQDFAKLLQEIRNHGFNRLNRFKEESVKICVNLWFKNKYGEE